MSISDYMLSVCVMLCYVMLCSACIYIYTCIHMYIDMYPHVCICNLYDFIHMHTAIHNI